MSSFTVYTNNSIYKVEVCGGAGRGGRRENRLLETGNARRHRHGVRNTSMDPHPRPHAASQREMHPPGGLTWHRTTPKAHSASGSPTTAEQAAPEPPKAASSSPFVPSDHREAAPFTAVGYFSLECITHVETTASFSLISTALQISECSVFSYSRFKSYQKMERTRRQRGTTARKAAAEALELKGRGRTSARISSLMGEDSSTNSSGAQLPTRRDPQQL